MRVLSSFLIILSLLVAPVMAQATDLCFGGNCTMSVDANKDIDGKSQSDTKAVEDGHCCTCAGCPLVFSAALSHMNDIEYTQEKPPFEALLLSGLDPLTPLEPPRII